MIDKTYFFFNWLVFGFGLSKELWYIERKTTGRVYHFIHFGYTSMDSPEKYCRGHVITITILFLTLRFGFIKEIKNE